MSDYSIYIDESEKRYTDKKRCIERFFIFSQVECEQQRH